MTDWKFIDDKLPKLDSLCIVTDGHNTYLARFINANDEYIWSMSHGGQTSLRWYPIWCKVEEPSDELVKRGRFNLYDY